MAPVGDPDWLTLRGDNALTLNDKAPALKLDDFFALNPAMPSLHRMFQAKEAIIVHASATPYRERSAFRGLPKPGASESGCVSKLPPNSPPELLESCLGPLASPETRLTVARAESRPQALALLVMAPEFLRR